MTVEELKGQLAIGRRALKVLDQPSDQQKAQEFVADIKRRIELKTKQC